jgi:hypothetical protein
LIETGFFGKKKSFGAIWIGAIWIGAIAINSGIDKSLIFGYGISGWKILNKNITRGDQPFFYSFF